MDDRERAFDFGYRRFLEIRDGSSQKIIDVKVLDAALCEEMPGVVLQMVRDELRHDYYDGKAIANLSRAIAGIILDRCVMPGIADVRPIQPSVAPPKDEKTRRASRLLAMVHELHKVGYQRLRIVPSIAPTGLDWRCEIVPAAAVGNDGWKPLAWDGAIDRDTSDWEEAKYTTGMGSAFFGWEDATGDDARGLARKFIARFPKLARAGAGLDWRYAGWFTWMLGNAEAGDLPYFMADWEVSLNPASLPPPP